MFWQAHESYEFGPFHVDARDRQLLREGEVVPITPKVFDILLALVQNAGHVLSKAELMKQVWPDAAVEEGNLARNVSTLRAALGERRGEPRYIETIPWRGYRFVAQVMRVQPVGSPRTISSIVVLPFINSDNDPELDFLADGIPEALINTLFQLSGVRVMSRNAAFRYRGSQAGASEIARDLKVEACVFGRVAKHRELLLIGIELVDARDESHIWGTQHLRSWTDLFTMPSTIAKELAQKLPLRLTGEEQQRLGLHQTENAAAHQLYLKGRYFFNKLTIEGVQKGLELFEQAIEKDPHYALAYVGLADCYNYSANREEAEKAVRKALQLNPELGEAHASAGFSHFLYDWNFEGAEREFLRALALSPGYAEAHHWYAIYLANLGRHQEAFKEAEMAVERDPLSLLMNMTAALNFYLARDYDLAVAQLEKVIEMDSNFPAAHSVLGCVYAQRQMYKEALAEFETVLELCQGAEPVEASVKVLMAQTYARWGNDDAALKLLDEVADLPTSAYSVAGVYAGLRNKDRAFDLLNRAYDEHDLQLVSLQVDPTLDGLREDKRFVELVQRVGFPN